MAGRATTCPLPPTPTIGPPSGSSEATSSPKRSSCAAALPRVRWDIPSWRSVVHGGGRHLRSTTLRPGAGKAGNASVLEHSCRDRSAVTVFTHGAVDRRHATQVPAAAMVPGSTITARHDLGSKADRQAGGRCGYAGQICELCQSRTHAGVPVGTALKPGDMARTNFPQLAWVTRPHKASSACMIRISECTSQDGVAVNRAETIHRLQPNTGLLAVIGSMLWFPVYPTHDA